MTEGPAPAGHRRADIQGLRAVAVVGVIAYHLLGAPRGGFLGVDVFFVVSGFVITGVLLRERERTGRTSLAGFYARRARRILPAALIVLVVTVLAAQWAYAPMRADAIRTDAIWAALFAANWHLALEGADYFQLGQTPSPVQHYWSLGVEEQFYLAWPWLFVVVVGILGARSARRGRAALAGMTSLIVVGSLAWAVVRTDVDRTTAYYSSLTRAWELALGALLALLPAYAVRLPAGARSALSWAGLAGVAASFLLIGPDVAAPFPAAVLPALATLAILLAGIGAPAKAPALTNPVSRYLGDISYGLYLWHFPLVVLVALVLAPGSAAERLTVLAGTLLLAVISYHLVERPILDAPRRSRTSDGSTRRTAWRGWWVAHRRGITAAGAALACLVGVVGATAAARPGVFEPTSGPVVTGDGGAAPPPDAPLTAPSPTTPSPTTPSPTASIPRSSPAPTVPAPLTIPLGDTGEAIQAGLRGALRATSWPSTLNPSLDAWQTTQDLRPEMRACIATKASDPDSCTFGNRRGPEIVVYGDSLGIPLLSTLVEAYGDDHKVRGLTKIACAVNGVDADFGKDDWAIPCVRHREMTIKYVKKARPEVLIMIETYAWSVKLKSGASGAEAAAEWLAADQAFVDAIKSSVKHVVILAPTMPGVAIQDCYRDGGSPRRCVTGVPKWWKVPYRAEQKVADATFLDTLHWYCVEGRCPIFTRTDNTVLKYDYLHPTVQYARLVADDLVYRFDVAGIIPARR